MAITINGTPLNDNLTGFSPGSVPNPDGIETINGLGANDILNGAGGDDFLNGGDGVDLLIGGTGADTIDGGAGDDNVLGGADADALSGGAGIDRLNYSGSLAGVAASIVDGSVGTGGDAEGDSITGFENLTGSNNDDVLTGNAGANVLTGNNGNDRLIGGGGADTLNGGNGNDTLSYQGSGTSVFMTLSGAPGQLGDAQGDTATGIENLVGSEADDILSGDGGANILVGRAGDDLLTGGQGNDHYDVDNAADIVQELDGEGTDTVYTSVSYALETGTSVEKLAAFATAGVIDLTGNALEQAVIGNAANNRIDGDGGGDALYGGGGNDTFDYNDASDSALGVGNVDTVRDFSAGDEIDLQDLFGGTLVFIGTGAYTAAGQVRHTPVGATGFVLRVNLDADAADEIQIYVIGIAAPVAGDLVL